MLPPDLRHKPVRVNSRVLRLGRAGLLAGSLVLASACVSPFSRTGGDFALAPLHSRLSKAGGGTGSESLFGMVTSDRSDPGGPIDAWAVRPFTGWTREPDGEPGPPPGANARWRSEILYPLGRSTSGVRTSSSWFLPLYFWRSRETAKAGRRSTLLTLPGLWWARDEAGGGSFAWFPFFGHVEDFLTYEEIRFFLFPLYSTAKRDGKKSTHFLFPVLGWTRGGGEKSTRLWPFWVHSEIEGFHDRTSVLWPFVHWQTNSIHRGEASTEHKWMVWPLYGRTRRGSYRSHTLLWPFFGWASDPRAEFWALDAPWPLVRLQSGGKWPRAANRTRVWPFYSHFETKELEWWTWAWPFVHRRREVRQDSRRDSFHVFPFWQSVRTRDSDDREISSWWKLWPLAQRRRTGPSERLSVLAPFPFHWDPTFDHYWSWPLELWTVEREKEERIRRERSWGGLWLRERDAHEDRRYLSGLFSRRTYREEGAVVRETSLLFGLIRWRSMEESGTALLAPSFPGPGWPAERSEELLHLSTPATPERPDAQP